MPCHLDIVTDRIPGKFSVLISANVLMCNNYPDVLDLGTVVEESVIVRRQPVQFESAGALQTSMVIYSNGRSTHGVIVKQELIND
jgi:hypothetical protein